MGSNNNKEDSNPEELNQAQVATFREYTALKATGEMQAVFIHQTKKKKLFRTKEHQAGKKKEDECTMKTKMK